MQDSNSQPVTSQPNFSRPSTDLTSGIVKKRKPILPLLIISSVTVLGLALVVYMNLPSLKRSIIKEIKEGNLTYAYDLYLTSKSQLWEDDLKDITEQAFPAVENRCNRILARLKAEAADSDWSEAARLYSWLNDMKPNPVYKSREYFAQARLAFSRKDYAKAIENYQKSIEIDPSSALAFNGLGRAYWRQKDPIRAKENYQRAIEIEPDWIYPYMNLGALYIELRDYQSAERMLQRALSMDSKKAVIHNLLGQVYEKKSRWCDAHRHYSLALENAESNTSDFDISASREKVHRLQTNYGCGR